MAEKEDLVYGETLPGWAVIPKVDAVYWAGVNDAIESGSWDQLKAAVDKDGRGDFDDWFVDWSPEPGERFDDPDDIPGYADGDYPPMIGQLMLEWLPDELTGEYGEYESTTLNGDRLYIEELEEVERLADELRSLGYQVGRDDELMRRATRW